MNKLLVSIWMLTGIVVAENPKIYLDMSPIWFNYESKGVSSDFNPNGFKWTMGYELKDFSFASVAIEGSALLGIENDKKSSITNSSGVTFTNAKVTVDKIYSLHLKGMFPLSNSLNANIYMGETRGKISSSSDQSTSNSSFENSFSYGAGLEYWMPANVSLYANYMQYFKNLDAVEVGVGFRF